MICGVVMLVLTVWVMLLVYPDTVLGSCSIASTHNGPKVCTPESPWVWLPLITSLLGAAAGGFGTVFLIRRRTGSRDGVLPPVVPITN